MSNYKRRLFFCLIGIAAGMGVWPIAELVLYLQIHFSSYLLFSIVLGAIFGIFMGGFFGTSDGIFCSTKKRILSGMKQGLLIGAFGGLAGFFISQGILFIIGEFFIHSNTRFNTIGLPLSRAIGWSFLGIFIGMIDGIRSRSLNKIKVGIIGGISGGFLGGLALEYTRLLIPEIALARLFGLLIFGLFIGLLYGFVEAKMSFGVLTLLNGKDKGKDFLISQHKIRIGRSMKNDIVLNHYKDIGENHAIVKVKENDVLIKPGSKKDMVYANDEPVSDHLLKLEDIIKIGSAKMIYQYK